MNDVKNRGRRSSSMNGVLEEGDEDYEDAQRKFSSKFVNSTPFTKLIELNFDRRSE